METRSRKRAEASTSAASSGPTTRATKRARLSATSSSTPSISTRSRRTLPRSTSMDPTAEPSTASASTTRSRRGKNPSNNQNGDNSNNKDNTNSDKGKEKEPETRLREMERGLGLNIDGDEDDNDSEGGVGILHQNLTSASSALQGLLRKLGAGLDDLLPSSAVGPASSSHQNGRLKKILSGLRADGEEGKQIEALTQLCDMLSMIGTEESLSTFSVDSFVPVLVGLLNHESNPDIMLFAARALTHLVDVLPSSCAAVVHYGAVSCFVARLLTIEYMDLAEQSLQALKKISQEHPTACLRAGALMAVLSYLDFFSTGVQRVALSTAANMCKKLPSDAADFVMEAVPLLTNLLQYHDAKVLEQASICLTRIAEAFASSPEKLDELCNHGLVTQAASLISSSNSGGGQASLSTSTYTGLIRLLSTCANGSPLGAKSLLLLGISGILKDILSGSGLVSSVSVSPALSRPPEQIFEIVNLANELLPQLPQGTISLPASSSLFIKGSVPKKGHANSSSIQEDSNGNMQEISTHQKLLNDQPELLQQFGMDLLPVLIQIYGSSVNGPVRHKCLSVIGKLMYFSTVEMIQSLMNVTNISSFLAGVLAWKDPQVLVPALQIAEILMEKLPGTFSKMFDDELGISPVELDEALVIEDDDISDDEDDENDDLLGDDTLPLCMPDKVHDVKLGDSVEDSPVPAPSDGQNNATCSSSSRGTSGRGSDSAELRSGSSFGSRGAMSFAAAAMAGLASGNNRGVRGGRDRQGHPLSGSNDLPRLIFTAGGRQLNKNLTIYQAIQRQLVLDEDNDDRFPGSDLVSSDGSRLWGDIYTIMYEKADNQATSTAPTKSAKGSSSNSGLDASTNVSLLDSILQGKLPCDLERSNPTYNILALLRVLEGLNQLAPRLRVQAMVDNFSKGKISTLDELSTSGLKVSPQDFVNSKLTPKLARQIQDALALCSGSLPSWCYQLTKACPFLFPFETRRQYFNSTAFGLSRALNRLQQQQGADGHGSMSEREVRVGRLQRQKVRISRNRILDSAAKVMEMYSSQKAVLEVEYFGEVGTGLGPTLEFYTLLSHDLQKVGLGMWRSSSSFGKPSMEIDVKPNEMAGISAAAGDRDIIHVPLGLFPQPWPATATSIGNQFSKVIEYFKLLGRVMAKALQDGRLLDLPLSAAFYKLVLGQELDLHDIISFDAELGTTLQELQALVCRKQYLESTGNYNTEDLRFHGVTIEDLCLDFSLPGYPEYVLRPGDENVDLSNLGDYVTLVVDATVGSGIMRQIEAFRSGFNQVFDISSLQIFTPNELDYLLCGRREMWTAESLADHIKFDHGYTSKSPAIVNLLEIMGEFTPDQQRAFCQFVTGAPRLPPGGLAVLNPKLTIVRKHSSNTSNPAHNGSGPSESADDDLPSVMTCANYLKLPPYSTKEIMYKKLLYAINEGQGSFDLS
ncbi:hypothetical protein RD792_016443 [Penstemon davidsonii]|uniref:HECT-type E3 ubiquitin transferase n=1 Tax=Penstemon davidsonii TaxID=160366 RepID=A0ABR0CJB1_9LAMI|nr:hypothetical protein RD792_016443 [Penstemon davidsonii]